MQFGRNGSNRTANIKQRSFPGKVIPQSLS